MLIRLNVDQVRVVGLWGWADMGLAAQGQAEMGANADNSVWKIQK